MKPREHREDLIPVYHPWDILNELPNKISFKLLKNFLLDLFDGKFFVVKFL